MNIFNILKGIIGAITLAVLSLTGAGATPATSALKGVATTTDVVVQETIDQATSTTKDDVSKAYELGKAVGRIQEKVDELDRLSTAEKPIVNQPQNNTMNQDTTAGAPSQPAPSTTVAPETASPAQAGQGQSTATASAPVSLAHIDIISPIPGKGIGPRIDKTTGENVGYRAADTVSDESNYIELGAIVYGDDGQPTDSKTVFVTTTDQAQDKTLRGTGDVATIYVDGNRKVVPVYSFHYEFKKAGLNKVVFTANGMFQEVDLDVK